MKLPLSGITVLEFSQYLAGPYAGLRLADLGARVIKVERPVKGDACRQLVTKNLTADGDSLVFHTINRNKESFSANLKDAEDLEVVKKLISQADVITHNFRPGIMSRLGLDYDSVKQMNPNIVYGEVTGYGDVGPWKNKPGQDLLAQSLSGLTWLTGNKESPPTPFGMAIADMICGTHLAQGILAVLVRKKRKGIGAKVQVSLLESIIDFQFEGLTAFLNSDHKLPERSEIVNAHAYLGAPYGIYKTSDSYISISMGSLKQLAQIIKCTSLQKYQFIDSEYENRDEIKAILSEHLLTKTTQHWLDLLEPKDYWCSKVLNYEQLTQEQAYKVLEMEQVVKRNTTTIKTTRCPIRINGEKLTSSVAAPQIGNANESLIKEFSL
jgi:crotonobetainyl-CoA:carnitine CoA-transferase CaiB-like acyl-CoA transferase